MQSVDVIDDTTPDGPAAGAAPVALEAMRGHAAQASALLKALAHEDRLLLLCQIAERPMTVGELEQAVGVRQPSLSQQLGVLRQEGLVATQREGKYIRYSLASPVAAQLLHTLHGAFCAPVGQAITPFPHSSTS